MDQTFDYNGTFRAITSKLKKRFLRKPNINEAIDEYALLSNRLENEQAYTQSAHCLQQVAKLHQNTGNYVLQSGALQSAAHLYLKAEHESTCEIGLITFGEDLLSALSLYDDAIRVHCDHNEKHLAGKLCVEIADVLTLTYEKYTQALQYYERALVLFQNNEHDSIKSINEPITHTLQSILVLSKLASLKIYMNDYMDALNAYTDLCNAIMNYFNDANPARPKSDSISVQQQKDYDACSIGSMTSLTGSQRSTYRPHGYLERLLIDSDICKLLLLLYIKPNRMKPDQSSTLEVYSLFQPLLDSHSYVPIQCMGKDLFILLQSFVMACQSMDTKIMIELQVELYSHLNDTQNFLLDLVSQKALNNDSPSDLLLDDLDTPDTNEQTQDDHEN